MIKRIYKEKNVWHSLSPDVASGEKELIVKFIGITVYRKTVEYSNIIEGKSNSPAGFKI